MLCYYNYFTLFLPFWKREILAAKGAEQIARTWILFWAESRR